MKTILITFQFITLIKHPQPLLPVLKMEVTHLTPNVPHLVLFNKVLAIEKTWSLMSVLIKSKVSSYRCAS